MSSGARNVFQVGDSCGYKNHSKLLQHARILVDMIDCVVAFLGPNLDSIEDFLLDLGARHVGYGVRASDIPLMCNASILAMKQLLGDKFTDSDYKDWVVIFRFVCEKMVEGMRL